MQVSRRRKSTPPSSHSGWSITTRNTIRATAAGRKIFAVHWVCSLQFPSNSTRVGLVRGRAMQQDTIIYVTNILIGTILACLMTHHWMRQGHSTSVRYWMLAAWVMTAADVLFAARPLLAPW